MFKKIGSVIIATLVLVFSCTSPVMNSTIESQEAALEIKLDVQSRTILPEYSDSVSSYTVTIEDSIGQLILSQDFNNGETMLMTDLETGEHQITIVGKTITGIEIVSGSKLINLVEGSNTISIELKGLLTGEGSVNISLVFPSGAGVDQIQTAFYPLNGSPSFSNLPMSNGSAGFSQSALIAGNYEFQAVFSSNGTIVARVFEIVWIRGNLTTEAQLNVSIGELGNPPMAPDNLLGSYANNAVTLTWSDNSSTESGFIIEKSENDGLSYSVLTTTVANTTQYTDSAVSEGTTVYYRVRSTNEFGDSANTSAISVTIPGGQTPTAEAPTISPNGGAITTSTTITMNSETNGATIYYTTDGSTPDSSDTLYVDGFSLDEGSNQTVKAITVAPGYLASPVTTSVFDVSGGFTGGIKVWTKNYSTIHYWDAVPVGSVASTTWPGDDLLEDGELRYFEFPGVESIKLIFNNSGSGQTGDMSRTTGEWWYDGNWHDTNPWGPQIPEVTANPAGGIFNTSSENVSLSSTNGSGDTIYYTLDGSTPDTSSNVYSTTLTLSGEITLRAVSINELGQTGPVLIEEYNIDTNNDITDPTISSSQPSGSYIDPINVSFNAQDNQPGVLAYYTLDGSTPTTSSTQLVNGQSFPITERTTFKILVVDAQGNSIVKQFFFNIGVPERGDFREETIYFVMTTRFYNGDTSNDFFAWDDAKSGNLANNDPAWRGDFKGLAEKLDYIKALGFSAVWVTPVVKNMSGYDYHGYHSVNHSMVDPRYESVDFTYQDLIDAVHARDMKIIQDVVLNHTGNFGDEILHPLFELDANGNYIDGLDPDAHVANELLEQAAQIQAGDSYANLLPADQFQARIKALRAPLDVNVHYHNHEFKGGWEQYEVQIGSIAGDCQDLNTENPAVAQYLIDAYYQYIDMGVDGFRVDTVKHISRLTFNNEFIPQFKERGGENFFIFGEVATRYRSIWNDGKPAISTPFFTWKESDTSYPWSDTDYTINANSVEQHFNNNSSTAGQPSSDNHLLLGNTYRTPDWSMRSGMDVIDFPMHWSFAQMHDAWATATGGDWAYSDATFNVTYIDSHDYAPDTAPENQRFAGFWPDKLSLIFTFRGIPTVYYGSEIEFKKGAVIDVGPNAPLEETGRAYFGDHIEGSIEVTDFGEYSNVTGAMATTLAHPLAQHIRRLNQIRRAIPALQKGQYSTDNVSGAYAFKRRYTDDYTDSFALVTVSGGATFNGIPNGTYVDAVTGDVQNVTGGSLSTGDIGLANIRVYVLDTAMTPAPGQVGVAGEWIK